MIARVLPHIQFYGTMILSVYISKRMSRAVHGRLLEASTLCVDIKYMYTMHTYTVTYLYA